MVHHHGLKIMEMTLNMESELTLNGEFVAEPKIRLLLCSPKLLQVLPSFTSPSKLAISITNFHIYPITTSHGLIYHQGEIVITLAACMG